MGLKGYVSDVVNGLGYSGIDEIFERASKMEDIVNLAMGQPDINTPDSAADAGIKAIQNHRTKYTDDLGVEGLREEVSKFYTRKYGVTYNPKSEIIIMAGVSSAIDTALRTIINPGDEIIVQQPGYTCYVPAVQLAGGKPVMLDTYECEGFEISPERLKSLITPKTKALVISYPNNPTGAVMSREDMIKISKVVEDAGLLVISDEIYSEMVYEGSFVSFASLPGMKDRTVTLNGVSKTYSMPGWRVGYACAPHDIIDGMFKIYQNTVMNVPSISQYAAAEALRNCDDYILEAHAIYSERRQYVIGRMKDMGMKCFEPKGAFYVFPSIKETGLDSKTFCDRLLEEAKVAAVPGTEFGVCGEGYMRCSYTTTMDNLKKGLDRIEKFINSLK